MTLGMVMVYSASGARAGLENIRVQAKVEARAEEDYRFHHGTDYVVKQIVWAALGLAAGFALLRLPIETLEKYALPILVTSFVILVLVVASPLGMESKGAKRWLRLVPCRSSRRSSPRSASSSSWRSMLAQKREKIRDWKSGFLPTVGVMGVFAVLIVFQKDLGTIMLMGSVVMGMWALAQVRLRHLGTLVLLALPALVFLVFQHSYRLNRILAFLDSEKYASTYGYQLNQSLIAVGSGGMLGQGLGFGLQKYHFLSESHTDFIFAIVCEELGLVGAGAVVLLFLAFILLGVRISYRAPDYFTGLLAAGLTMIVGCAAFINFFVVLGMAPTKGLALPFFTYGGSSMMASVICAALLINISNYTLQTRGCREVV